MAHCNLCGKNTRCSCKGGGCPSCNSTNKQIAVMNDLLKFGLSKDVLRSRLSEVKKYVDKIDTFTLYEFMIGDMSEEDFNTALEGFKPIKKNILTPKKSEVVDTTGRVNPERMCRYPGNSPWDRCIYCNSIRKYMSGKECPKFKETLGDTDVKND